MSQRFQDFNNVSASGFALDPSGGWSACAWLYIAANTGGEGDAFYVEPSATPGSAYAIRLGYGYSAGPTLRFRAGDGTNQLNHTEAVTTGQWYHLAITYDGVTARAYLDGSEVASQSMSMSGAYNSVDLGDFAFGTSVVEIGQVKVWEGTALTPSELADEIAYWEPQTDPGNVYAWWQLDASFPTLDSSGNGRSLSGPGSADGSFAVPGDYSPPVTASGGSIGGGTAAVSTNEGKASGGSVGAGTAAMTVVESVVALGAGVSAGRATIATNVFTGGGGSALGGRDRGRKRR